MCALLSILKSKSSNLFLITSHQNEARSHQGTPLFSAAFLLTRLKWHRVISLLVNPAKIQASTTFKALGALHTSAFSHFSPSSYFNLF